MSEATQILGPNIVKKLSDKSYEKRKQAANDIEKVVKDNLLLPQGEERVVKIQNALIHEFIGSPHPNFRKGGLIGLAAVAISVEQSVRLEKFLPTLVPPLVHRFKDEESRVRYYACEAMYNVAKVAKKKILKFFNRIFEGLCTLITDVDQDVKNGAQHLNRLIEDIVTDTQKDKSSSSSSKSSSSAFDLKAFIPMLTNRIRVINPFIRQLILGWIHLLQNKPTTNLIAFLPQFLDGLLQMLAETSQDIRGKADLCLADFLKDLRRMAPHRQAKLIAETTRVVVKCCSHNTNCVRMAAVTWLSTFVELASAATRNTGDCNFDFASSTHYQSWEPIPPLADDSNEAFTLLPDILRGILPCVDHKDENIASVAVNTQSNLQEMVQHHDWSSQNIVGRVVDVLVDEMKAVRAESSAQASNSQGEKGSSTKVRTACLQWVTLLLSQKPAEMIVPEVLNRLFDPIFETLRTTEHEVVLSALQVLAQIMTLGFEPSKFRGSNMEHMEHIEHGGGASSSNEGHMNANGVNAGGHLSGNGSLLRSQIFSHRHVPSPEELFCTVTTKLLMLFQDDRRMLMDDRGRLVIRVLCSQLDITYFYSTIGQALAGPGQKEFRCQCVQVFNWILLSAKETKSFRELLLRKTAIEGDKTLFLKLLHPWFVNPVAALSLCLWVQEYRLAMELTQRFATLEPTVEFLNQIDILVNLLESPIFCRARIHLLEPRKHPCLLKTILGLCMLLPQAGSFDVLHARLSLVQSGLLLETLQNGGASRTQGEKGTALEESNQPGPELELPDNSLDATHHDDKALSSTGLPIRELLDAFDEIVLR